MHCKLKIGGNAIQKVLSNETFAIIITWHPHLNTFAHFFVQLFTICNRWQRTRQIILINALFMLLNIFCLIPISEILLLI